MVEPWHLIIEGDEWAKKRKKKGKNSKKLGDFSQVMQNKWIFRPGWKKKIPWGTFPFGVIRGGNGEELRMVTGHWIWGRSLQRQFWKLRTPKENPGKAAITVISAPGEGCGDVCTHTSVSSISNPKSTNTGAAGSSSRASGDEMENKDARWQLHHGFSWNRGWAGWEGTLKSSNSNWDTFPIPQVAPTWPSTLPGMDPVPLSKHCSS